MNILSISKDNREAVVLLSSGELNAICNALYKAPEYQKDNPFYKLYSDMMIARDISQYGHIDNFCLEKVLECREHIQKKS
jgi:hypothetical protein